MPNTAAEFVAWCLAHPTDNNEPGETWDQKCGSLVFRAGGFSTSADSAYRMALATEGYGHHLFSADELPFDEIPFGWFVYFDKAGPKNGHIGMSMGDGTFLSANWRVRPMSTRHKALGLMDTAYYASISDRFMGSSPYFINSTLAGVSSTASSKPLIPVIKEVPLEDDMKFIRHETNGSLALIGEAYVGEFGGADQDGIAAAVAVFGEWKNVPGKVYVTAVERANGRMLAARTCTHTS